MVQLADALFAHIYLQDACGLIFFFLSFFVQLKETQSEPTQWQVNNISFKTDS